ncbi:type II secretion system protein [Campylobacter concisus]
MDHNALLTQLGYNIDETTTEHMRRILNNTDGLLPKSVIELNDHLKLHLCFVAMSGSEDRLKIKNVATVKEIKSVLMRSSKAGQINTKWISKR